MMLLPKKIGPFTLMRKLGSDGITESYVAIMDQPAGKQVVVRRVLPFAVRESDHLAAIRSRIDDLTAVRHPVLVPILRYVEAEGEHFVIEDRTDSVALSDVLDHCRANNLAIPHNIFLDIATQICNGLEALHGRPGKGTRTEHVLHLKLEPSAIVISSEGRVMVGDFGLVTCPTALTQGSSTAQDVRHEYLAPEQTHPDQVLTPAADIFTLGSLLFELLTQRPLFRAPSPLQTIHAVRRAEVTTALLEVKEILPGLDKVLYRALSLNPRHRYQRAFVLREDLRALMAGFSFANIAEDTRAFLAPLSSSQLEVPQPTFADAPAEADSTSRLLKDREPTSEDSDKPHTLAFLMPPTRMDATSLPPTPGLTGEVTDSGTDTGDFTDWHRGDPPTSLDAPPLTPVETTDVTGWDPSPSQEHTGWLKQGPDGVAVPLPVPTAEEQPTAEATDSNPPPSRTPAAATFEGISLREEAPSKPPVAPSISTPEAVEPAPPPTPMDAAPAPPPAAEVSFDPTIEEEWRPKPSKAPLFIGVALLLLLLVGAPLAVLVLGVGLGGSYWITAQEVAQSPGPGLDEALTAQSSSGPAASPPKAEDLSTTPKDDAAPASTEPTTTPSASSGARETATAARATPQPATTSSPAPVMGREPARETPAPVFAEREPPLVVSEPAPEPEPEPEPIDFSEPIAASDTLEDTEDPAVADLEPTPLATDDTTDDWLEAEPQTPSAMDDLAAAAKRGTLTESNKDKLAAVAVSDPSWKRAQTLLYQNAKVRGDWKGRQKHLATLMSQPENTYDPTLLVEQAAMSIVERRYASALETANRAERHWQRLPSDLIFSRKAMIYEAQATSYQGMFFESGGEDLDSLRSAIRHWQKYERHVKTKSRADLAKKAELELAKLFDAQRRLE